MDRTRISLEDLLELQTMYDTARRTRTKTAAAGLKRRSANRLSKKRKRGQPKGATTNGGGGG